MADLSTTCERFSDLLAAAEGDALPAEWGEHLAECAGCRDQWIAHRLLEEGFAGAPMPEPSPIFDRGLRRKLAAVEERAPLRGWRLAALGGYGVAAAVAFAWVLLRFPPLALDSLTSPWGAGAALLAAPVTLWMASAVAKRIPLRRRLVLETNEG